MHTNEIVSIYKTVISNMQKKSRSKQVCQQNVNFKKQSMVTNNNYRLAQK